MTPRSAGFTLLETLVALVLLAIVTTLIAQSVSDGLRGVRRAEAQDYAVRLARAKLASVGHAIPLSPGTVSGEIPDERAFWSVSITPYNPGSDDASVSAKAYRVHVKAGRRAWRQTRQSTVELFSIKTAVLHVR